MLALCDVCGHLVGKAGVVVGGSEECDSMTLCGDCAVIVFPGLRELMIASCPVCAAGGAHS